MKALITEIVELTRKDKNAMEIFAKTTKMGEEFGELCEAVLLHKGAIAPKDGIGTPIEEGVDNILMILDILSSCYPEASAEELYYCIMNMMQKKLEKWKLRMVFEPEREPAPVVLSITVDCFGPKNSFYMKTHGTVEPKTVYPVLRFGDTVYYGVEVVTVGDSFESFCRFKYKVYEDEDEQQG
jgi:hypothetical protein